MYTCEGTQCSVTIPPPPELGLDLHSDPSIARIAATSLIYANTWSYGVENVLNALESGRWVILVHVGPQDPGFQDTIMFLLKLLTQCPWLKVTLALSYSPPQPYIRPSSYFWEHTTAAVAWQEAHGTLLPPFVALTMNPRVPLRVGSIHPAAFHDLSAGVELPFCVLGLDGSWSAFVSFFDGSLGFQPVPAMKGIRSKPFRPCPLPGKPKLYVYPDDGRTGVITKNAVELRNWAMAQPEYTANASEACLFIVPFDTSGIGTPIRGRREDQGLAMEQLQADLQSLPYWFDGSNHILFDQSDSLAVYFRPGNAVMWKAGYDRFQYRSGLDVSFPIMPLRYCTQPDLRRNDDRPVLLSFKGSLWSHAVGTPPFDVRRHALGLHNADDVIVVDSTDTVYDYTSLLAASQFCLCMRGTGLATFRYLEVLSYGCVPVILADNWVPFLSELVDPSTYTITIPEKEVFGLVAVLRSIPRSRVHSLRAAGAMVYEEFFGNPARAALDLTQARVLAATAA